MQQDSCYNWQAEAGPTEAKDGPTEAEDGPTEAEDSACGRGPVEKKLRDSGLAKESLSLETESTTH